MKLLFMCVANSARSQMAEGLARKLLASEVEVASAGSKPAKVNPFAVLAMKEIGIDLAGHHSKSFGDIPPSFTSRLDYVVTLCAEEVCPAVDSRAKKLHLPLPDPAGQGPDEVLLGRFRTARNSLVELILDLARKERLPLSGWKPS